MSFRKVFDLTLMNEETGFIYNENLPQFNVQTKKDSTGFQSFSSRENVLTIFFPEALSSSIEDPDKTPLQLQNCLSSYQYGGPEQSGHDKWHAGIQESGPHVHIAKFNPVKTDGPKSAARITPAEMQCLTGQILQFQKEHMPYLGEKTESTKNNIKINEKEVKLLTEKDAKRINSEYKKFYEKEIELTEKYNNSAILNALEPIFLQALSVTCHSALSTILQKYFKPYLINQLHSQEQAVSITEGVKTVLAYLFTSSFRTQIDMMLRVGLHLIINRLNSDLKNQLEIITNAMRNIQLFIEDFFSIPEWGLVGSAAALGQILGYEIISLLPKLKDEELSLKEPKDETKLAKQSMFKNSTLLTDKKNEHKTLHQRRCHLL